MIAMILLTAALAGWTGVWVGGTTALGEPIFVQAEIAPGLEGTLEVPAQDVTLPLRDIKTDGDTIAFRLPTPFGEFQFQGTRAGSVIRGEMKTPMGTTAAMHLRHTETEWEAGALAGTYLFPDGEYFIVTTRPNGQLRMIGTRSLTSKRLVRIEGDRLLDAASVVKDPDAGREVTFDDAKRLDLIDQERVALRNGAIQLGATLFKPHSKGPHPAAVVVHGSGAVTRDMLLLRAQLLIRRGVAVLLYDKRGTGESTGDWRTASFEDLASDALAAVRYLRTRDDIDPSKLGVIGHSQAGWIVPIVAKRDPELAFAIVLSGGAISPEEQEIFRAEAQTRDDFPKANALQAKELTTLMWQYARTGENWPAYEKAWQAATGEPWFRNIAGPRTPDDPMWRQVRLFAEYDPMPYLRSMRVPTLVILGADDENQPTTRTAGIWRSVIRESKLPDSDVVVVRGAGHNLMTRRKDGTFVYAPEYVEAMERWLRKRVGRLTKIF